MAPKSMTIWLFTCFLVQSFGLTAATDDISGARIVNVGVVIDPNTRIGKEQRVGIEIATEDFNNSSENVKLSLNFGTARSTDPLQAASSARELVEKKRVEAIIGTETWQEAALLGEIGNQYNVPILSLAEVPASRPLPTNNSFLVQMTSNYTMQIGCIASLVKYYGWKRVIAVYEDDGYDNSISFLLDGFSQVLQDVGSEIEYFLALPPIAFMTDPKQLITEELAKVLSTQSRVFVVLRSSLPLANQLFKEAKIMGLIGRDTVWIVTDSVAGFLDFLNSTVTSDMEGTLGIKSYYDESNQNFKVFSSKFFLKFHSQFLDEEISIQALQPGIHALKAYDAIITIGKAFERLKSDNSSGYALLEIISSSNFTGLSGEISIKDGVLEGGNLFRIVNVVGKTYKELDFCSSEVGFFQNPVGFINTPVLHGSINWPGDINQVPKGWAMPTNVKPLKIGVPGRTSFEKFVKVDNWGNLNRTTYSGFCIDIFLEVVKIIEESYALPYEFEAFYGTYDELVDLVHNKTYDAVVGDVTILANRSMYVEFSQPFTQSGLSMIVPLKSKEFQKAHLFIKPFSWQLWLLALATLLYTMLAIWWVERRNTSDTAVGHQLTNQLSDALWYTFSSLFFAHRENIQNTFLRITVLVWLFVVLVLTQSYTASLTSMLTVPLLEPKVKDIRWLLKNNSPVGCDGDSFVCDYLVTALKFSPENIKNVSNEYLYPEFFANGKIVAAFLELPYEKVFLDQYCSSFTHTSDTFRFGGQGFVFQKGSPLADDVSKAILKLSENGVLKELNDKWFPPSSICSSSSNDVERLKPEVFSALYVIHFIISAICFMLFSVPRLKRYISNRRINTITLGDRSFWNSIIMFAQQFQRGETTNNTDIPNGIFHEVPRRDRILTT